MKIFQLFVVLLLLFSCQGEEKCKYKITPIFKNSPSSTISNHSFDHRGTKATEKVTFQNGVRLELFQTICNASQQDYHFYLKGDFRNQSDQYWINQAAEQFFNMARSAKEVEGVSAWGVLIQNDPNLFKIGEKVGIQDGMSVKIDKLVGIEESQVIITISQEAS